MDEELNPHLLHWLAIINLETQGNIVDKSAERFESSYLWGMEDTYMYWGWGGSIGDSCLIFVVLLNSLCAYITLLKRFKFKNTSLL